MGISTVPGRLELLAPGPVRTVLACVPPGPAAHLLVEQLIAAGRGHLVRLATTPRQAILGYARKPTDVVIVDYRFTRDPIRVLGPRRSPNTAVIVVDAGRDGELLAALAGAATGATGPAPPSVAELRIRLTCREQQVLRRLCDGATNEEIADELSIGADTVKTHVRRLYAKLGARRRTQAVAMALRSGLVE
ncbi:MAG: helix-turn-helix transcriptional regulator [Actinocatenispora sp.]